MDKDDYRYNTTLFKVEKVKERKEKIQREKNSEKDFDININKEENLDKKEEEKQEKYENNMFNNYILKNSYIKLKSKFGNLYMCIRVNNRKGKESNELLMTKSISDLIKFKLDYLEEEDKYELNFFEQLLWSLKNLLSFFKQEKNTKFTTEKSYEKIQHVLITFEKKIKMFRANNNLKIRKEKKFDFLKIIEYFDIVEILINLFLANWFNKYENLDYEQLEEEILIYFKKKKKN